MDELNGEFHELRQKIRKYIRWAVKQSPCNTEKLTRILRRIKKLDAISHDDQEIHQAIAILVMQKEIELNDDGEYIIPGTTPTKKRFRSLDATWDS